MTEKLENNTGEALKHLKYFRDMIDVENKKQARVRVRKNIFRVLNALRECKEILIKQMGLCPKIIVEQNIFPYEPFQSEYSKAFFEAVKFSNYDRIERLLAIDRFLVFQYDECKQTGLMWAAKRNNTEMVKYLCEKHSRVNFRDICGRTALLFATRSGNLAMVKTLLSFKADP